MTFHPYVRVVMFTLYRVSLIGVCLYDDPSRQSRSVPASTDTDLGTDSLSDMMGKMGRLREVIRLWEIRAGPDGSSQYGAA